MDANSSANIEEVVNFTKIGNATSLSAENPYDSYGAMLFIIAVIVVYGVAVIGMLGFYNGKGEQMEDFDKQANRWLKEVEVRQRQLEIKSRKSAFTKRLKELRSDLSYEHVPRLQSHVANYLIASIGMKSRRGDGDDVIDQSEATMEKCTISQAKSFSSVKQVERTGNISQRLPIICVTNHSSSNLPQSLPVESPATREFKTPPMLPEAGDEYSSCLPDQNRKGPSERPTPNALGHQSQVIGEDSFLTQPESIVSQAGMKNEKSVRIRKPESQTQHCRKAPNSIAKGCTTSSNAGETEELLAEVIIVEYESVV